MRLRQPQGSTPCIRRSAGRNSGRYWFSVSWVRQVLRVLREAEQPPGAGGKVTDRHVARVLLGLASAGVNSVVTSVASLEAAPNRYVPIYDGPAATGAAIVELTHSLVLSSIRTIGAIEVTRE